MANTIGINKAKDNIEYLLRDWKGNIKNFDIVMDDILARFEKTEVPAKWGKFEGGFCARCKQHPCKCPHR